jgi:hypothetical protein
MLTWSASGFAVRKEPTVVHWKPDIFICKYETGFACCARKRSFRGSEDMKLYLSFVQRFLGTHVVLLPIILI